MLSWIILAVIVNGTVWLGYGNGLYDSLGAGNYSAVYRLNGVWYVVVADMAQSEWVTFGALLVLSLVCLLLAWKSNMPILNFVFGAITFGAGAYFLGADMVLSGWINLLAILMAIMCILRVANLLRNG